MPEDGMEFRTLRPCRPLCVGTVTLVPIERFEMQAEKTRAGVWFRVQRAPWAILVRDPAGVRAIAIDGEEVTLKRLRDEVPE